MAYGKALESSRSVFSGQRENSEESGFQWAEETFLRREKGAGGGGQHKLDHLFGPLMKTRTPVKQFCSVTAVTHSSRGPSVRLSSPPPLPPL